MGRELKKRRKDLKAVEAVDRRTVKCADAPHVQRSYVVAAFCGILVAAVVAVYLQTAWHEFINYDDDQYVYENRHVLGGLTSQGAVWAATSFYATNWHPLTWLSHMADCELYGLKAGGHHLTNVFLHAVSAVLLFLSLLRMTALPWPSAWVAAVFAMHPLRVESVAWVAERKDVLSGLFFMLSLLLYARYAERPGSWVRYFLVVLSFVLGLMAKPMLVTLPFVFLLLDFWPLSRFEGAREGGGGANRRGASINRRLFVEKIPLFALAAVSCAITLRAQHVAIHSFEEIPLSVRFANAAAAYIEYLEKMVYPIGLAVFYPLPKAPPPVWETVAAVAAVLAISIAAFALRRKRPYLLFGWLWYLGTLAPVIGLVQVGDQKLADRYTYLPQIGLYIAIAWWATDLARNWRRGGWGVAVAGMLSVAALIVLTLRQTSYWRDSETLWLHTLSCTSQNALAHKNFGIVLAKRGRMDEAVFHYHKALEIAPDDASAEVNLGTILIEGGRVEEAVACFRRALSINPDMAEAHYNFAIALAARGQLQEAIDHYRKTLEIDPEHPNAHNNLGNVLVKRRQFDEAIEHFQDALKIRPDFAEAQNNLGRALAELGRRSEAIEHYRLALKIRPDYVDAYNNLGNALANEGDFNAAIAQYQKALEIRPDFALAHSNLSVVLASCGRLDEAVDHGERAVDLQPKNAEAHFHLASALAAKGKAGAAIEQYEKALQLALAENNHSFADKIRMRLAGK